MAAKLLAPCAAVLAALLLAACGGSGKGLIPAGNAGPLRRDFEAVARVAAKGNGSCAKTDEAISRMKRHFAQLPRSVDVALREKLEEGIENLTAKALALCEQPKTTTATSTVETFTTPSTSSTSTTSTETETETTETEETEATETEPLTEPEGEEGEAGEEESGGTGVEAPPAEEQPSERGGTGGASAP